MDKVNNHPCTTSDMDAALVSCFPSSKAKLRLHADNEPHISQTSSICTISFGPPRTLEFVKIGKTTKNGRPDTTTDSSEPALTHSMNVMRPGCQQVLKHRVPVGQHLRGQVNVRYSISFRKIVPTSSTEPIPKVKEPEKNVPPKESVVLMAGDSFFERLDAARLGKNKKKVINIAKGGSKMESVLRSIDNFVKKNLSKTVSKCFISIGTNDIRNCTSGIMHLKTPLCNFMKSVKQLLPQTKLYIQSLLPIPTNGSHHVVKNVYAMNNLIFSLCSRYKILYLDNFSLFLDNRGRRKLALFPEYNQERKYFDIHPNQKGMGVLAKEFIFRIHSKWFNPLGY